VTWRPFVFSNQFDNAVSIAIGDNGNRLIFKIWWNFFYDLFSIKNVADVNSIDSFVSNRNMEEFSVVIMKRFRSNWFKKTKRRHVTYNTRQSVLRRKQLVINQMMTRQLQMPETTENSSIFRLLTKESMLLTSATFLIEKRS
jgi:hypothetical protein